MTRPDGSKSSLKLSSRSLARDYRKMMIIPATFLGWAKTLMLGHLGELWFRLNAPGSIKNKNSNFFSISIIACQNYFVKSLRYFFSFFALSKILFYSFLNAFLLSLFRLTIPSYTR